MRRRRTLPDDALKSRQGRQSRRVTDSGWQRDFDEPIQLPDGRTLVTLHDAATYITGLPKKEAAEPDWQAAIAALMLVVELGGPTMFARIGVMKALNRAAFGSLRSPGNSIIGGGESSRGTGCDLVHILGPKKNDSEPDGADQTTRLDHARHIRPPVPRILPCPPRRDAETASDLA